VVIAGPRRSLDVGPVTSSSTRTRNPYTSKTQDAENATLHVDVNDYFVIPSEELWERAGVRGQNVSASTLIASPRIEVGRGFQNVRDGVTHKALRSASSFQQKVGRVGRGRRLGFGDCDLSCSADTDAHFAHHPARLIDAQHLDPFRLRRTTRSHQSALFTAALDFIASRPSGTIPNAVSGSTHHWYGRQLESSWRRRF